MEEKATSPRETMAGLRKMALTTNPRDLGFGPDKVFPVVYGLVVDWHIGELVATIAAMRDGSASLYTTSTFGVIGGIGYKSVRDAAQRCVILANNYAEETSIVTDFPYPNPGEVNFYLLTYNGVLFHTADEAEIKQGQGKHTPLFMAAQNVLAELRLVTEKK
jgi:hypothetical protein